MADKTTNYELPTEDARYLSLEAMVKTAFEKIDLIMKGLEDRIEAAETAIAELPE